MFVFWNFRCKFAHEKRYKTKETDNKSITNQSKENYELSYGRYHVGVGNPIELREAQVQYQDAMLQYYNALYQFNSAKAELEKFIGKNLTDDEVQLDIDKNKKKKKPRSKKHLN